MFKKLLERLKRRAKVLQAAGTTTVHKKDDTWKIRKRHQQRNEGKQCTPVCGGAGLQSNMSSSSSSSLSDSWKYFTSFLARPARPPQSRDGGFVGPLLSSSSSSDGGFWGFCTEGGKHSEPGAPVSNLWPAGQTKAQTGNKT